MSVGGHGVKEGLFSEAEKLLSRYNPVISFENIIKNESINFTVNLKNIHIPSLKNESIVYTNVNDLLDNPSINCCFPGVDLFDAVNGSVYNQHFIKYLYRCVRSFIVDVIHKDTSEKQHNLVVFQDGNILWDKVIEYYNLITQNLTMFKRGYKNLEGKDFSYILGQLTSEDGKPNWRYSPVGINCDKTSIIEIAGFNKEKAELGAIQQAEYYGNKEVSRRIKFMCSEYLSIELYYLRYDADSKQIASIEY